MMQDTQALSVGSHDAVLNTIVDHLDEVTGAIRSTKKIPLLGSSSNLFTPSSAWCCIDAGSQGREDRVEMLDDLLLTANHQAVTALEAPDASTRSAVHIVNTLALKLGSAPNIIVVVGITAIDDDVPWCEMRNNGFQQRIRDVTSNCDLSFAETRREWYVSPANSLRKTQNVTLGPKSSSHSS